MIKLNFTLILLLALWMQAGGQTKKWTLQECIDYGVDKSLRMERQLLNNKVDQKNLRDATLDLLPSANGSSSLAYSFGRSLSSDNTYVNSRIMSHSYYLGADLNLFSGFAAINTLRYRKVSKLKGLQDSEKTANDIAVNIIQAFYDLAYAEGLILISQEQVENARLQLKQMERQHELGIKPKSDLFDIQAKLAESEYNLISNQNRRETALVALKQAMNYEPSDEMEIEVSSLSSALPEQRNIDINSLYAQAKDALPEVSSAEYAYRAAQLNWYVVKGRLFPSFSASGSLDTRYYNTSDETYRSQMKNNLGKSFGFSVSIPIFGGLYRHSNVARAKYQMQDAKLAYEETLQNTYKEIQLAALDLKAAAQEYDMALKKESFSQMSYEANKKKYQQGLVAIIDLNTSDNNLRQAQHDVLKARLTYGIKKKMVDFYQGIPLQSKIKF